MDKARDRFLIVDGNSMLFRAFYATSYGNIMKTSTGIYTNAVYAFSNMLNKAISNINPKYVAVAFDKGKHTFRHDLYEEYKAGRKKTPDELVNQFSLVRDMLDSYGIKYIELDEIEADDIIGTLSNKYEECLDTYVLSSDKDMLQLVDDDTTVVLMKKGISDILSITPENIVEFYGVNANQVADLKSLMGDTSDNIKGIDGVGEKTAKKLINAYGHLENIYENLDDLKGKLKERIINGKENAYLSKKLATIKTDVELDFELSYFDLKINDEELMSFYRKYEMFSLVKNIPTSKKEEVKKNTYTFVNRFSKELLIEDTIVYGYFNDFDYYNNEALAFGISNKNSKEIALIEDVLKDKEFLEYLESDIHKIIYGLKINMHYFKKQGININNCDDIALMGFLCNNNIGDINILFSNFNVDVYIDKHNLLGTQLRPKIIDDNLLCKQIDSVLYGLSSVYPMLKKKLNDDDLNELYHEIELPLVKVLHEMEEKGILIDENILDEISKQTFDKLESLTQEIYQYADEKFNINSPKQLASILFDKLELYHNKKRSTAIESLEKIVDDHPIIPLIIEYRKYAKIYSTYSEGLKKYIKEDHRIHTFYSQMITQTGRLSSFDPNLQNISVKTEEGKEIRKAFIADEGSVLVSSDYSQIELRILAHMAKEDNLIEAFKNGLDIHTKTAMDIFDLNKDDVNSEYRRKAKAINFGIIYGISDFGLAKQADISIADARIFMDKYFEKYPKIKTFMDGNVEYLYKHGYVKTILNRRRYINEINNRSYTVREFAKRAAFNSPIQGSGADIIKIAMINIAKKIKERDLKSSLILQVHDELIFNVLLDEQEEMKEIITEGMHSAYDLLVPLICDYHVSSSLYIDK